MKLAKFCAEAGLACPANGEAEVTGFAIDNRKVAPGTVFGAFQGARVNGEDFIAAAIEAGYLWLAVIGILNSVLALAVYLRIVVPMYQARDGEAVRAEVALPLLVVLGATALVTALMGLFAGVFPG